MTRSRIITVIGMALAVSIVVGGAAPPRNAGPAAARDQASNQGSPDGLDRVRPALSHDGTAGFSERVHALRGIKTGLTGPETDVISQYLRTPAKSPKDRVGENWLRNVMLDKMVQQSVVSNGLPDLLVTVYQDARHDVVMRDYAVQHMPPIYSRVAPQHRTKLRNALWQATGETDSSIAGTALLALLDIAQSDPAVDTQRLAKTALKLASDDRSGELCRITAVQVCGRMQVAGGLPVVEQLAQTATNMPLRIAATAALADYGTPATTGLLMGLAKSPDARQALAAKSALHRIAHAQAARAKQVGQQTGSRATR